MKKWVRRFPTMVLLALAGGGCHEGSNELQTSMPADGDELPILRRYAGTHSHELRAIQFVVRDEKDWSLTQLRDVPVDFDREMLLVVTLGQRTSDRIAVNIERVWREGGVLRVETSISPPPDDAPVGVSTPFCIAVVPKCGLNVAGFSPEPPERRRSWSQSPRPTFRR